MLTPQQAKRAIKLYDKYKCDTSEYQEIANLDILTT